LAKIGETIMIRAGFFTCAALLALTLAAPASQHFRAGADPVASSSAIKAPPIAFTEWTLPNGLRVIAIPDKSTANVMGFGVVRGRVKARP
jgi:zinc protease